MEMLNSVKAERMDKNFILWRLDKQSVKDSHSIFSKLVKHHISSLIRLNSPEFNKDFVEDIPRELQFPGNGLRKSTTSAEKAVKKGNMLVVEAMKIVGNTPIEMKRRTRYVGDYNKEIVIEAKVLKKPVKPQRARKESNNSMVSLSSNKGSSLFDLEDDSQAENPVKYQQTQKQGCPEFIKDFVEDIPREKKQKIRSVGDDNKEKAIEAKVLKKSVKRQRTQKESNSSMVTSNSNKRRQIFDSEDDNPAEKHVKPQRTQEQRFPEFNKDFVEDIPREKKQKIRCIGDDNKEKTIEATVPKKPVKPQQTQKQSNTFIVGSSSNKRASIFDSEDDSPAEDNMPAVSESSVTVLEPPMKRQKVSQIDDESLDIALRETNGNEENELNGNEDDDDDNDAISLNADDVDFDDDDVDYTPPTKKPAVQKRPNKVEETAQYVTDLDDLKMIVRKEPILTASNARSAFMRNTDEIMKNAPKPVDDATDKILKRFFNGVCRGFIENSCKIEGCKSPHRFPNASIVHALFRTCTIKEIDNAYGVVSKHTRFLETYISVFAELYVKQIADYESRLARMIMDCEQNAKCHQLYRPIVDALETHGKKQRFEAIQFLIKHHTSSPYAKEAIMNLCVETGAEIVHFMDYFSQVYKEQSIPMKILDTILLNCVKYQKPSLPDFCLNNLLTTNPTQLRQLNSDSILKFINLQKAYSEGSAMRANKLHAVEQKIQELRLTRAP